MVARIALPVGCGKLFLLERFKTEAEACTSIGRDHWTRNEVRVLTDYFRVGGCIDLSVHRRIITSLESFLAIFCPLPVPAGIPVGRIRIGIECCCRHAELTLRVLISKKRVESELASELCSVSNHSTRVLALVREYRVNVLITLHFLMRLAWHFEIFL